MTTFVLPANFKKITLQDIFNAAWDAFIVGDKQPARDGTLIGCQYLTPSGNRCAVGLCIPDGHPAQSSSVDFRGIANQYPELFDDGILGMKDDPYCPLSTFQAELHDNLSFWDAETNMPLWAFSKKARKDIYVRIAKKYGLTVPNDQAV